MAGKSLYRALLWSASLLGVLCFIFANSLTPKSASAEESRSFFELFLSFLPGITHHLVRKLAHVAEYALLGAHLAFLPILFSASVGIKRMLVLIFGICIACIDEGIQRLIPGRGAAVGDVLLDTLGYFLGLLLMFGILFLISRKRKGDRHA